ncbi:MAG: hypothetical protein XD58_1445 [Thermotoga sp. 50_1627]|nr:MAG: hypothetical protein XD58_1445 [Thermotoga sp. 50_1627]
MKKGLIVFCFLVSAIAFGLPAMYHVSETERVLGILRIPAKYEQLWMFHRAIDTVPGSNVPGGFYHRERWGHDTGSLKKLLTDDSFKLSTSQRKITWAIHILQDAKTTAGVSKESVMEARKILSKEFFKSATIRAVSYISVLSILDFVYQITLLDVDTKTALKNTITKFGITMGTTIGMNFLFSKIFPYIYSQPGRFLSFLPSGLVGPIAYITVDIITRAVASGSFTKALFSFQTLLSAAYLITSFFVPGGQFIFPAAMALYWIYNWVKAREIKVKWELFDEKFDEYLLIQAEMSVR